MTDLLAKGHVKGYSRKDGTYVSPHERSGEPAHAEEHYHPARNDDGKPVLIKKPSHPSLPSTWHHADAVATFVPNGDVPRELNGVPFLK